MASEHFGPTFLLQNLNDFWSAGPGRPSDESNAIVAGCLYMYLAGYLAIWLSGYLGIFLCLVVGSDLVFTLFGLAPLHCQKDQPGYRCFHS